MLLRKGTPVTDQLLAVSIYRQLLDSYNSHSLKSVVVVIGLLRFLARGVTSPQASQDIPVIYCTVAWKFGSIFSSSHLAQNF